MEFSEFKKFDEAMISILKADPKVVKREMEDDARDRAEARKVKRASSPKPVIEKKEKIKAPKAAPPIPPRKRFNRGNLW
jgi:hypothetical protein